MAKRYEDLTGQKFGRLIVLEATDQKTKDGRRIWKCLCECGNIKFTSCQNLKRGHCTSCGCKNKEQITALGKANGLNLINQKFGKLTVLEKANNKLSYSNSVAWVCVCECGNKIIATTSQLNSGNTSSCGCSKKSEGEEIINEILIKENIKFKREAWIQDLKSKTNKPLQFDFYLFDYNCYIEFDGEQHYKKNRYSSRDGFIRDCAKNEYCLTNNIKLYRIPYEKKKEMKNNQWTLKNLLDEKFLVKKINHYNLPLDYFN